MPYLVYATSPTQPAYVNTESDDGKGRVTLECTAKLPCYMAAMSQNLLTNLHLGTVRVVQYKTADEAHAAMAKVPVAPAPAAPKAPPAPAPGKPLKARKKSGKGE